MVDLMLHRTSRGVPDGSAEIDEPDGSVDASWVWKGPRTVPSVLRGGLGWSMESTSSERPRISDRRIYSCLISNILHGDAVHVNVEEGLAVGVTFFVFADRVPGAQAYMSVPPLSRT